MLESYVTPLLMSYVNKYIKNLKPSDLQLSLWGGDVVLSKLDLKLDVLEQELKLPFTFMSGHIHELRIHVPWTKLGSEPVVITINTMECILKLRDGAQNNLALLGHPACSPALNLVENILGWIARIVYKNGSHFQTVDALREAILTTWSNVPTSLSKFSFQ
ncbi:hypothetical protein KUCAC02_013784 [Chaenocephalus aceratus]|uniref:Uncharacterized protein n=1 Tax=Chaenocephalus aceratus TaxID=36190 RepID=A0ACB9WCS0_CHAAC|nr:hypothetical protein KUCAC02_013784 [Chaenocephalus aceratus]